MSLMSILSNEPPRRGPKDTVSNPIYRLTEKYKAEIGEAREKGYSWSQIVRALKKDIGMDDKISLYKVEEFYNAMRKREGGSDGRSEERGQNKRGAAEYKD